MRDATTCSPRNEILLGTGKSDFELQCLSAGIVGRLEIDLGQHFRQASLIVGLDYCIRMGTCMRPF